MRKSKKFLATFLALIMLVSVVSVFGVSASAADNPWPAVQAGSTNQQLVKAIQYLLTARGYYSMSIDGSFGPGTTTAVKNFQSANGLTQDGSVGPATWPKLIMTQQSGANSYATMAIQMLLNEKFGANLAVDGSFGPATVDTVKRFQAVVGLGADGSVGPATWNQLITRATNTSLVSSSPYTNNSCFTFYNQGMYNTTYGTSTIAKAGCGIAAFAMAVTALKGCSIDPPNVANTYKNLVNQNQLSLYSYSCYTTYFASKLAAQYNLTATNVNSVNDINTALRAGKLVEISGDGASPFTTNGHYILIRGITSDGKWLIADSNSSSSVYVSGTHTPCSNSTNYQSYDAATLFNRSHKDAVAIGN